MHLSNFIQRLQSELEDIQQDLDGLLLNISDCKIGDFGCEYGYKTLGLMLDRDVTECIGVDKFMGKDLSPSLEDVQQRFDDLKATVLALPENSQEDKSIQEIRHLLRNGRWPTFRQNDILKPHKLPDNLDLAYCNKFLKNIYSGGYDNFPEGREGLALAVNNMLDCVKQNGLICLVEERSGFGEVFEQILDQVLKQAEEQAKLTILDNRTFSRQIIGKNGRISKSSVGVDFWSDHLLVYHARKL